MSYNLLTFVEYYPSVYCCVYIETLLAITVIGDTRYIEAHRKRSSKLVKTSVLLIKYFNFFARNKVTVVLKLALLVSHMDKYATALIGNLWKNQVKWFIVPLIIVQLYLPVDGVIRSPKQDSFASFAVKHE